MTKIETIENEINNFLLRDIVFFIENGKTVKRGKLILFRFKEFHFNFTLKTEKGDHKIYEIPYPYRHEPGPNSLKFSYDLDDFTLQDSTLFYKAKTMNSSSASKLHGSKLVLSAV